MTKMEIIRNVGTDTSIEYIDLLCGNDRFNKIHNATIQELADLCDQDAESCSNHFAVGIHRMLATLLCGMVGPDYTQKIMLEIAEYGGIDGMSGYGGKSAAYNDLKINPPWDVWNK